MLGFDSSYICHSFPKGWSPYSFRCGGTCQDWHFFLPVGIVGYPIFITKSCLFLSPSLWKSYGTIISSLRGFFYGLLTRTWFFHAFNKCSFKYHVSTSQILCKSNYGRLVISLSYHICIPFVFGSFSYKLRTHLGLPHPTIDYFGYTIVNVDIPLMFWCPCKIECTTTHNIL
jgi:hypothetical protein